MSLAQEVKASVVVDKACDYILETEHLTKEFKGFVALADVNLRVRRGSIHTLIGPNGAGKTTCFNLLTKFLLPSKGRIFFNGREITNESATRVAQRGLVRSFQISAVFPHLSVHENVRVALQRKLGTQYHFWRSDRSLDALNGRAMDLLAQVGLEQEADRMTAELAYGKKRALEIATTLALDPELMLLDEPTSGMGIEDVASTMELIRSAAASRTVLMVEHNMKIVAGISDTITVLSRGAVLAEGQYDELSRDPRVVEAYMGTQAAALAASGTVA
jgi:branched-chain amino acid transport system ATP-binding protein